MLDGGYRETGDPGFTGRATPARGARATVIAGLAGAGILTLWSVALS